MDNLLDDNDKVVKSRFLEEQEFNIKKIFSNTDYVLWLDEFINDKKGFSDEKYLLENNIAKNDDYINIMSLSIFYYALELYAKKNNIESNKYVLGESYKIKLDDISLEVGTYVTIGIFYFCERTKIKKNDKYIDVDDLVRSINNFEIFNIIDKKSVRKRKKNNHI